MSIICHSDIANKVYASYVQKHGDVLCFDGLDKEYVTMKMKIENKSFHAMTTLPMLMMMMVR